MTDTRELIESERRYGMALSSTTGDRPADFVMRDAGESIGRLCASLAAALEREEALRNQIKRLIEENIALRCIAGGGCYANDDGPHNTIIRRGKERFCNDCGENVNLRGRSNPWLSEERLERAVQRIAAATLKEDER